MASLPDFLFEALVTATYSLRRPAIASSPKHAMLTVWLLSKNADHPTAETVLAGF
ncbi:MAG: hypothetical protein JO141_19605 [Bradyrhizobium sp.]|nr:hypothetical protein [Bradyrhizobium sp.]